MNILKRKQVIIYTMALMLVTAGYLNYMSNIKAESSQTLAQVDIEENNTDNENKTNVITSPDETNPKNETIEDEDDKKIADIGDATLVSSSDIVNGNDYFIKSKLERETMYSQMLETYEKILNSNNSNETQKQTATQEIKKINEQKNSIMICENLIKTKGFENNVIFVNNESVSAIIGSKDTLKKEEIAQIQNIISRELKVDVENIHISTK